MPESLASLIDRAEFFLADSNNKSWSTGTITECMRYALAEINKASGIGYTINGLDDASTTTLPVAYDEALIIGTAAYCAKNRALDRMEKANLGEGPEAGLQKWADWAEKRFNELLEKIRIEKMHQASTSPHSETTWDEDTHKW